MKTLRRLSWNHRVTRATVIGGSADEGLRILSVANRHKRTTTSQHCTTTVTTAYLPIFLSTHPSIACTIMINLYLWPISDISLQSDFSTALTTRTDASRARHDVGGLGQKPQSHSEPLRATERLGPRNENKRTTKEMQNESFNSFNSFNWFLSDSVPNWISPLWFLHTSDVTYVTLGNWRISDPSSCSYDIVVQEFWKARTARTSKSSAQQWKSKKRW